MQSHKNSHAERLAGAVSSVYWDSIITRFALLALCATFSTLHSRLEPPAVRNPRSCSELCGTAAAGGRGRGGRGGSGKLGAGGITTVKDMQQLQLASYAVAASPKVWQPTNLPPVRDQGERQLPGAGAGAGVAAAAAAKSEAASHQQQL
jgi:hypothetical protein